MSVYIHIYCSTSYQSALLENGNTEIFLRNCQCNEVLLIVRNHNTQLTEIYVALTFDGLCKFFLSRNSQYSTWSPSKLLDYDIYFFISMLFMLHMSVLCLGMILWISDSNKGVVVNLFYMKKIHYEFRLGTI
jgi:hypothetical protein